MFNIPCHYILSIFSKIHCCRCPFLQYCTLFAPLLQVWWFFPWQTFDKKNIWHAITWMLLSATDSKWSIKLAVFPSGWHTWPVVGSPQWLHWHLHMHSLRKCLLCCKAFSLSVVLSAVTRSACRGECRPVAELAPPSLLDIWVMLKSLKAFCKCLSRQRCCGKLMAWENVLLTLAVRPLSINLSLYHQTVLTEQDLWDPWQ